MKSAASWRLFIAAVPCGFFSRKKSDYSSFSMPLDSSFQYAW